MNAYEVLKERGFIAQMTHEEEIIKLLADKKISFYIGFDPTADSLTAGHFLTVMAMAHMQRAGHKPIILFGGATAMIGDPSGRTDMRKMLTRDEIDRNIQCFKEQMSKFIDFSDDKAVLVNNADWLGNQNYIQFLRDIGPHFTINRMLNAECYKSRLDIGLTFLEFNYMIMQSYDFLYLYNQYDCILQLGGDDQWSNIIGGVELVRRVKGKNAYGMTFNLLTTKDGKKMGKTQKGAVWLDPLKTTPYEFYQYWRNIEDASLPMCLERLTFLPMEEVRELSSLRGENLNQGKEILAFELTQIVHGMEEAKKAQEASRALFSGGGSLEGMPSIYLEESVFMQGMDIMNFITTIGISPSRSEGRRLLTQGGIQINGEKVLEVDKVVTEADFNDRELVVQKGKKTFLKVILK
jgi:tyrosyl-tRNA synthetase